MTAVACVGIAVLDIVMNVPHLPTVPGKYRAARRTEVGGGVAANAAATIAALGGQASFFGCLGDDPTGDRVVSDLAGWGVATGGVRRIAGEASPLSTVLVDATGERLIVNHAADSLFTNAAPVTDAEVRNADVVLTDMRWPRGAIPALQAAHTAGKPAIVDCDHDPADAPGIIEEATHVVFALATLRRLTRCDDPGEALRAVSAHTPAWVAATAGGERRLLARSREPSARSRLHRGRRRHARRGRRVPWSLCPRRRRRNALARGSTVGECSGCTQVHPVRGSRGYPAP